jgi:hypothetical protein
MTEAGDIPAPPQEKSEVPKATWENDKTSVFQWLRDRGLLIYMTAALSTTTPFKHERIEAAEIPSGATWTQGIEKLHNGVMFDNVETHATFYLDNQDNRGKWIFGKEGALQQVSHTTTDIKEAIDREILLEPTKSATVCEVHTHPLSAGEVVHFISDEDIRNIREGKHSVSFPPSGFAVDGDISLWEQAKLTSKLEKFKNQGVTVEVRKGVVDAAGITYHRPIKDTDLKQEFPEYFAEVGRRREIYRSWEEVINPLVQNLDLETIDRLHRLTSEGGEYDPSKSFDYSKHFSKEQIAGFKRRDLLASLRGGKGNLEIAGVLLHDNPKAQKHQEELMTHVINNADRDMLILNEARDEWIKISKSAPPEQLTSTKEYLELREAFARNAAYIRFVPHQNIPTEPPCAGTDYKP